MKPEQINNLSLKLSQFDQLKRLEEKISNALLNLDAFKHVDIRPNFSATMNDQYAAWEITYSMGRYPEMARVMLEAANNWVNSQIYLRSRELKDLGVDL